MLENTSVETEISHDQVDWLNSLKEKLIQVQKDLNFYNNILKNFIAKDIVLLGLDSKGDIIQESSIVMTTANAIITADITADVIIIADEDVVTNSYT